MGTSLYVHDTSFGMKKDNFKHANDALRSNEKLKHRMSGGQFTEWDEGRQLMYRFRDMGFVINLDEETGGIDSLWFDGDSYIQEHDEFFKTIAKYVDKGSYISCEAEIGCHFQWYFNGDCLIEKDGKVVYE